MMSERKEGTMNDKALFHPVTGAPEMAEPAPAQTVISPVDHQSPALTSTAKPQPALSTLPTPKKVFSSQTSSATTSPKPSRESSPIRPDLRSHPNPSHRGGGRSRTNSLLEASPTRSTSATSSTISSAAAARKVLNPAVIPQLRPSVSEPTIKAPIPQKAPTPSEPRDPPRWPVSPRLRSPPPVIRPLTTLRQAEQDLPAINVQRSTPTTEGTHFGAESEESLAIPGMRTPVRGASGTGSALETVQEVSQPSTPALDLDGARDVSQDGLRHVLVQGTTIDQALGKPFKPKSGTGANESGSESGGTKSDAKMRSTSLAPTSTPSALNNVPPTKSFSTSSAPARAKVAGEGSTKNMTVETETVSSIPQVAVGGGAGGGTGNGASLRAKPSSETIRPKKEKKKAARKAPSVTSGNVSSKADIFEAKIASAVDEANSSDSEETFVYESNPPEVNERPRRFHSRTPSATSMASQVDQRGNRPHGVIDGVHGVTMKKSMKFANSYNSTNPELGPGEDDGRGTARSNMGTGRGTTHHHHIGRWGRNGGNGHASLFDNASPFPNVAKSKLGGNTSRNSSRPSSPKVAHNKMVNGKKGSPVSSGYDIDDGAGADDERTPLMGSTIRSNRSGRRRQPFSLRQLEHQASRHNPSFVNRCAGVALLSIMIFLVVVGAVIFMFATTQPLEDVEIVDLKHIITSVDLLMFDMDVSARNPNIVVINIEDVDIELFAKSKHSESDWDWWDPPQISHHVQARRGSLPGVHTRDDSPDDPYKDPDDPDDSKTTLLGRLSVLDSPLTFEGSPFKHTHSTSTSALRLAQPGNTTTADNTERWERLIKYEFELLLKGTLKYQLPMSQRTRSVNVDCRAKVKPSQDEKRVVVVEALEKGGEGRGGGGGEGGRGDG